MSPSASSAHVGLLASAPLRQRSEWNGMFSRAAETDCPDVPVEGTLPPELVGAYYRNGPGNQQLGSHFFDGDGMIRALFFDGQRVRYRSRYVATPKYLAERGAKEPQRRTAGTNLPGGVLGNFLRMPTSEANTSVLKVGDRLLALYEGSLPFAMDPATLETRGVERFGGALSSKVTFSAHPHSDCVTGEVFNFGVTQGLKTQVRLMKLNAAGQFARVGSVPLPYNTFLHDFFVTQKWIGFLIGPLKMRPLPFICGLSDVFGAMEWSDGEPLQVFLVRRSDGKQFRIETDPFMPVHMLAAWDEGDRIVLHAEKSPGWQPLLDDVCHFRDTDWLSNQGLRIQRMEIDPTNGRAPYETAFDLPFAFGNSDLRRASLPVRYTYLCVNPHVEMDGWFRGVGRFDFQTGQMRVFDFGAGHATHEPLFVPRPGGAEEDDGWLLVYVHNAAREATDVQVLSARAVEDGPIATLHLPVHAGLTFHGTWVPAA